MANRVEVDETEYLAGRHTAQLVQAMLANPDARKLVLRANKLVNPKAVIPEIDAAEPITAEMVALRDQVSALTKQIADDKEQRATDAKMSEVRKSWDKGRRGLKSSGYMDDAIEAIEKIMEERGITDHDVAAAYYDRLHPPQTPAMPDSGFGAFSILDGPSGKDGAGDEFLKKMLASRGEDEGALRSLVNDTLKEVRGQQPARR